MCKYACPRSISNTRFVTRSRTWRSCVTIASPPGKRASVSSRKPIASRSKWFVGSSRIRQSHSPARRRASATRFSCPPDNSRVSASVMSPMPNLSSIASPCQPPPTASRTVPSGSTGNCGNTPMRAPRPVRTTPASGRSSPDRMRNSVLLPQPFKPTTPKRSPVLNVIETSSNKGRPGRDALSPSASIRIMSVPTARKNRNQCERRFVRFKTLQSVFALEQCNKFSVTASQNTNTPDFT
ncbi:unannotated protein [freshwater metagenome]|uniref:Unannotated protein n=1 Tax=freshwater metagenome TaxID=449393 RepID=A0A6J7SWY7_9ZZZZ